MPLQGPHAFPSADAPEFDGLIGARTGDEMTRWVEANRTNAIAMPAENLEALACSSIPEHQRIVSAAAD